MKSRTSVCISAITLFFRILPVQLAAQRTRYENGPHHDTRLRFA